MLEVMIMRLDYLSGTWYLHILCTPSHICAGASSDWLNQFLSPSVTAIFCSPLLWFISPCSMWVVGLHCCFLPIYDRHAELDM